MQPKITIPQTGNTKRRSISLTEEDKLSLRTIREQVGTDTEFSEVLGIDRVTLLRVLSNGSGSGRIVTRIRKKIGLLQKASA